MNKYIKWIIGIIGTILLGAIGSGVWEWILSDLFSWIGTFVLSTMSSISQVYLDSLYKDIWKGAEYSYLKEIYVFTFVLYLMMPVLFILARRRCRKTKQKEKPEINKDKKPPSLFLLLIFISILTVMLTIKIWETTFSVQTASVFRANIEIIAPYISQKDTLSIMSPLKSTKLNNSYIL